MVAWNQPLREVVDALEIAEPLRHRKVAARKVVLQRPARYRAVPIARPALRPRQRREVGRGQRTVVAHLLEDRREVIPATAQFAQRIVLRRFVGRASVGQQGPGVAGNDRGLVRPLLRVVAAAVHETVEPLPVIGAEPGPEDEVVRRYQDVDEIQLQHLERLHGAAEVARIGCARGPVAVQVLRGQRNASRLRSGESDAPPHPPRVSRSPAATLPAATEKRASTVVV